MPNPPDQWVAVALSSRNDDKARSSKDILSDLNVNAGIGAVEGTFTAVCSDGTFVFIALYKESQ